MQDMKKLLIFHRTIAPYRLDFFNDLYEAFDTKVCLQYKNLQNQKFDYNKILSNMKFIPFYLPVLKNVKGRIFSRGIWHQLRTFKPHLVIVGEFDIIAILVLLFRCFMRKHYKVISICDDSYDMVENHHEFSLVHRMMRKLIVPHLDELILVEPRVVEWYHAHYGKGICFPIIKKEKEARDLYFSLFPQSLEIEEKYRLKGRKVYLFVGRLVSLKNVDSIIKAYSKIHSDATSLVIIGDGPERESLELLAEENNIEVIFTGRLEGNQLWAWYNVADVFMLLSYQESFGAVVNEALLAGCKCIVSEKAGSQCLVENDKNGYVVNPTDLENIAQKMLMCPVEPAVKLNALRDNQMRYSYTFVMNQLINHLRKL